ncbi:MULTISPECIES: rod shape-determining protein RodA [unclassified Novosphingobium]|uniref:rod shape-determining protein RodA n=1 Tax=unclassified Novosphingobium TaxID=2644732 RepID=UPI0026006D91|nr:MULTISPECIES: rod shape-determining protein RodA [unclassified Novosphingobium]HQV02811.1 rod shape-determining protein RodA [Novosphingobium sp.]
MTRRIIPEAIKRESWEVIIPLFVLNTFGSVVLYSAASGNLQPWALLHTIHFAVFLVMAFVISRLPREFFKALAYPSYAILVTLLLIVDLFGAVRGGSQRWIDIGFMQLQPSELMKPGIVLTLAYFFDTLPPAMTKNWRALLPAGALIVVPTLLVIIQPDLGTGLSVAAGAAVVVFLAGLPMRWFVGAGLAGAALAPIAFFTLLHDYQRKRVLTFLNPEEDLLGTGYHITQSKIAIGSGGFWGKGFGNGSQSHLEYLPEAQTDFAFATMAEEWGVLGGLFVIAVFLWTFRWGLKVARNAPDRFSSLLAAGMTFTVFFYMAINMLMVMGLAPVVGIPLPWISHGGSALMTNMACIGTIMAVERWSRRSGSLST